jgi:hypothetical protein
MPATKGLRTTGIILFALLLFDAFARNDRGDAGGHAALGAFALLGAAVSLYLLYKGELRNASLLDWFSCAFSVFIACVGFVGLSLTLFALYLFFRDRNDLNTRAAGTVAAAVTVQVVWAPLIFSKISFLFLQIDAGVVGWLVGQFVPGASWDGTIVSTPSGHDVMITSPCASFHNLSLASLCWVTLTMLHRPYWIKGDLYVGLGAMLIQFGLNLWRLVFVCVSPAMYEFWHEGLGKHIFSAVATASAIVFVQLWLSRSDQAGTDKSIAVSRTPT